MYHLSGARRLTWDPGTIETSLVKYSPRVVGTGYHEARQILGSQLPTLHPSSAIVLTRRLTKNLSRDTVGNFQQLIISDTGWQTDPLRQGE